MEPNFRVSQGIQLYVCQKDLLPSRKANTSSPACSLATARPVSFGACPWRWLLSQLRNIRLAGWGQLAEDKQEWAFLTNQEATHTERRAGLTSTAPPRQRIQSNQAMSGELLSRLKSSLPKKKKKKTSQPQPEHRQESA